MKKLDLLCVVVVLFLTACGDSGSGADASSNGLVDSRDGQSYRTVTIGTQTWMAENLNYQIEGSYCYGDDPANCSKYGRLYEYDAAEKSCPIGWHLPNRDEWWTLLDLVNHTYPDSAMYSLWATGFENWPQAYDALGFSIKPAGNRGDYCGNSMQQYGAGEYCWLGESAFFQIRESSCILCHLICIGERCAASILPNNAHKSNALSVRCLKDDDEFKKINDSEKSNADEKIDKSEILDVSSTSVEKLPPLVYGTITDSRDGKTYKTIVIDSRNWMVENLKYEYRIDGRSYPDDFWGQYEWRAAVDALGLISANGKDCGMYKTCSLTYPVLGICPEGWHIPDISEWQNLNMSLWQRNDAETYNAFGVSVSQVGFCDNQWSDSLRKCSMQLAVHNTLQFWSASEYSSSEAYRGIIGRNDFSSYNVDKTSILPVRCVQDTAAYVQQSSSSDVFVSSSSKYEIRGIRSSSSLNEKSSDSKVVSSSSKEILPMSSSSLPSSSSKASIVAFYMESAYLCVEIDSLAGSNVSNDEGVTILDKCPSGGEKCDSVDSSSTIYIYPGGGFGCAEFLNPPLGEN